ncbi:hypothetical protein Bbelb_333520 [Branchiostoma belcheri]|nr:hypothetical protein Bbelb_333520 [Branchiostoma belcheri]
MASSLADEIAKLTNPAPKSIDPEDDIYTETSAKVADRFEEYGDDDDAESSRPRHHQPVFLSSLDSKYAGKATSRSALQDDWGPDYSDKTQDLAKAAATKCQLGLWDSLLEGRIKLQKALPLTNQLPQPDARSDFTKTGGEPFTTAAEAGEASLRGLLETLLELQRELLIQNPETSALVGGGLNGKAADDSDEEITSEESDTEEKEETQSRKRPHEDSGDYPDCLQKRHKLTQEFNLSTIEKWSEKTKLSSGKYNSKAFSSFNKSVREQIDQILGDQDRLVKRTQLKRSSYKVLGRGADKAEEQEVPAKLDPHLKEYDEEIFDDDDFYHQLLRELIERKTTSEDPTELTKQWLEVQKLRKRVRKKVDTRASKGRKIRYDVHRKLVNFMAPVHNMAMSEEGCNELLSSLFGKKEKTSKTER